MDSSISTDNEEMNNSMMFAIRLYETHKNMELFKMMLDSLNINTTLKNEIIKSAIENIGV